MTVPGTPAAVAWAAGLDATAASLTPEWVTLEAIRSLHGEPQSFNGSGFEGYLRLLERYEASRLGLGPTLSLSLVTDRNGRERLETYLRTVGLSVASGSGANPPRVVRRTDDSSVNQRAMLLAAGVSLEGLEDRLNAGEEIAAADMVVPSFAAPLPMYEVWWEALLEPDADLFAGILSDRRTALLFYGLSSLDAETRQYLVGSSLLRRAYLSNAATFAAYGGSLRVHDGRVVVPGGDEAVAWWEALAGASVSAPDLFIERVLSERGGRLAYFYALLDAIEPARARFVIGLSTPPAARPSDVFAWFNREDSWFQPERRPFSRPLYDPTPLVAGILLDDEGRPRGPQWRYLWDAVFGSLNLPGDIERELRPAGTLIDAPYLFDVIFGEGIADPRVRLNAVLFAQRVFDGVEEGTVADLVVALRGFQRFPMLCLTLERAGIRSPATYRAAVRAADNLSAVEDSSHAFASLSQFQGAIALIEIAARTNRLNAEQAAAMVESLSSIPLDRAGSFGGDVSRWIDIVLVPAVSVTPPSSGASAAERAFLAGLSGLPEIVNPSDAQTRGPIVEWDGWRYHVDPSRALFARMMAVRDRQAGNTLDAILKLSRVTAALSEEITLDGVAAQARLLEEARAQLREPQIPIAIAGTRRLNVSEVLLDAVEDLGGIDEQRRVGNAARVAARLHTLTAALTADFLRSVTYAIALPDPRSSLLDGGDVSHQHDLGVEGRTLFEREGVAWGLPERQEGGPDTVRARGSLLGLDLALADLALGQAVLDRFERPANWTFEDLRIYVQTLVLFNPFDRRLANVEDVARALRDGRQRLVDGWANPGELDAALRGAGVAPLRRALIAWMRTNEAQSAERLMSTAELVRLGGGPDASTAAAPWGASALVLNGCLCLAVQPGLAWEFYAGRGGAWGYLGARSPDLLLVLADALHAMQAPPSLAADVLPVAMQSIVERTHPAHVDDLLTIVRNSRMSRESVGRLVGTATEGRSLFPASPTGPRN